jgi:hypothetical protein
LAVGVIPKDGTEVRRGSTYKQGESRRGERRSGNRQMSPYNLDMLKAFTD